LNFLLFLRSYARERERERERERRKRKKVEAKVRETYAHKCTIIEWKEDRREKRHGGDK
jgi:hypothetical protein